MSYYCISKMERHKMFSHKIVFLQTYALISKQKSLQTLNFYPHQKIIDIKHIELF